MDRVLVVHAALPLGVAAQVNCYNAFEPDPESPEITFAKKEFIIDVAQIDGQDRAFGTWLAEMGADLSLPLVANFAGTAVNTVIHQVQGDGSVLLGAPSLPGLTYRLGRRAAKILPEAMGIGGARLYMSDELPSDPRVLPVPATFGQIAYILMTQTITQLAIGSAAG